MNVPKQRASDVTRQIKQAFAEVPYPGDEHLVEGHNSEAVEVADLLRGRHWQDLRLKELLRNRQSVFFMTPEAIRFYLPVYLMVSLLHYEEADTIPGSVMFLFKPPATNDPCGAQRFEARFGHLTSVQREAIKQFLEYMRDEHAEDFVQAREATDLLQWWGRLESSSPAPVEAVVFQPSQSRSLMTMLGVALATLGTVGLALTFRWCGLNPSRWFIITTGGTGKEIAGWTIVGVLVAAVVGGLFILALSRTKQRGSRI